MVVKPNVSHRKFPGGSELFSIETISALVASLPAVAMSALDEGVVRMNQVMEDVYHEGQDGFWEPNSEKTRRVWAAATERDPSSKDVMEGVLAAQGDLAALTEVVGIGGSKKHNRMAAGLRRIPKGYTRDYGWPDEPRPDRSGWTVAQIAMAHEFGYTTHEGASVPPRPWLTAAADKHGEAVTHAMVLDADGALAAFDILTLYRALVPLDFRGALVRGGRA